MTLVFDYLNYKPVNQEDWLFSKEFSFFSAFPDLNTFITNKDNMKRSDIKIMPEYFDKYISQVDDIELDKAFENNLNTMAGLDMKSLESIGDKVYAPGKWTTKDLFQHVIDTERVFAYRSLRFARRDGVTPQGYDQDIFAANSNAQQRTIKDIVDEMKLVHQSTCLLFRSFDKETLQATGICWKVEMPVLALGFTITGHFIHHMNILKEKYLPLQYQTA